jgi:hypothetical protein
MQTSKRKFLLAIFVSLAPVWCRAQSNVYTLSVYAGGVSYSDICSFDFPFAPHQFRLSKRTWLENDRGFTIMSLGHKKAEGDAFQQSLDVVCVSGSFSTPLRSIPPGRSGAFAGPAGEEGSGDLAKLIAQSVKKRGGFATTNTIPSMKTSWVCNSRDALDVIVLDDDQFAAIEMLLHQTYGAPDSDYHSLAPVGNGRSLCYTPKQVGVLLNLTADSRQTIVSVIDQRKL